MEFFFLPKCIEILNGLGKINAKYDKCMTDVQN